MILCCGEALIDMIPEPTVSGKSGFVPHCGGSVFNTAIALGRLGQRVGMLTGLSSDMFGQQLRAGLAAAGVDASYVITSDRPTTLAFVQLQGGQASYSFFDENSAGRMLTAGQMPGLSSDVSALYFGGISLACEPAAEAYAGLLMRECDGRAVMIDPNVRPAFIKDASRYRARLNRMMAKADIVKISDEDLDWLVNSGQSLPQKAKSLLSLGPSLVILTRGRDGATGYHSSGYEVHVPSKRVKVVDTVGAGDTFNAGVLAGLSDCGALGKGQIAALGPQVVAQVLKFGAKVAGVTVAHSGANPPWAHEL